MKRNSFRTVLLLVAGLLVFEQGQAQLLAPRPGLWFSFDGAAYSVANIGSARVVTLNSHPVTRTPDRFNQPDRAVNFWSQEDPLSTFVTADTNNNTAKVRLFGYSSNDVPMPDNFTISCWIYADPGEVFTARKIFYTDYDDSRFALIQSGSGLDLRRMAKRANGSTYLFDYFFGAPATFDAGVGWYHVILVMGHRLTDHAIYSKVYVGKPAYVKYDQAQPRIVNPSGDPLASNFGGSYGFTGVQEFMNKEVTAWGLGNADSNDPIVGTDMVPVQKMDDLTVWGTALTDSQAVALFRCEAMQPASQCWLAASGETVSQKPAIAARFSDSAALAGDGNSGEISVSPNPTTGQLWVKIPATDKTGAITLNLRDLNGRLLYNRKIPSGGAAQVIGLDDIKSAARATGVYLLEVILPDRKRTIKVLVE